MNRTFHRINRAFTLVELLVTILILAILCALLFPSVKFLVERANQAKCVSNLRQIGVAICAYAGEHGGELPINILNVGDDPEGAYRWYLRLNPYLGKPISPFEGGWAPPSVFICPTGDRHTADGENGLWKIWGDYGYACNLALMPILLGENNLYPGPGARMATLPKHHVLISDTGKDRSQFLRTTSGSLPYDGLVENARIHNGGVNLLWTDFSVSWMKAEEALSKENSDLFWY